MKRLLTATLAAACLVGVTACGSDDKKINLPAVSDNASGDGSGSDSGSGNGSGALGDAACVALMQAMGNAAGVSGQGDAAEWQAMTEGLIASVPDDLKDDAEIFAQAYGEFLTVMAAHEGEDNPMSNPEVMAALATIGTPRSGGRGRQHQRLHGRDLPQRMIVF